jgi:hypothetical protein
VKRVFLPLVAAVFGLSVLSSCARVDPRAASLGTRHITIHEFEKHLGELSRLDQFKVPDDQREPGTGTVGVAPISLAQGLLTYEIGGVALEQELAARGLSVSDDEKKAAVDKAKEVIGSSPDQAAGSSSWDKLSASTQAVFINRVARQEKLTAEIKAGVTDAELQAFYDARKGEGTPPFDQVKDQVVDAVAGQKLNDLMSGRAKLAKVDVRYGRFYPETGSFSSPEALAAQAAAQAAQTGG